MSAIVHKYKIGDKVIIEDTKEKGTVIQLDKNDQPVKVLVGTKTVDTVDKVVSLLSNLVALWRFIKGLFKL